MSELLIFFLTQTFILAVVVVGAHVATKVQIAKLEVNVKNLQKDADLRTEKVDGISKNLAELTGKVTTCPHLNGGTIK